MTISEFKKIEAEGGFDYAVELLSIENMGIWSKSEILEDLIDVINDGSFEYARKILGVLAEGEKFEVDYWKVVNDEHLYEPIKSIDDIIEFLDDEGGNENDN